MAGKVEGGLNHGTLEGGSIVVGASCSVLDITVGSDVTPCQGMILFIVDLHCEVHFQIFSTFSSEKLQ
jgi:hypothetical protein